MGNLLIEKRERIRNKGRDTRNKRKTQTVKSFEIKLDKSKISKERIDNLKSIPHVKASISNEARSPEQTDVAHIEAPNVRAG